MVIYSTNQRNKFFNKVPACQLGFIWDGGGGGGGGWREGNVCEMCRLREVGGEGE